MRIIPLDTETTGLEEGKKSIVELGLIIADFNENSLDMIGDEPEIMQDRFKPREKISFASMGVHHITEEDVADCDDISERAPKLIEILNTAHYLLGHNLMFDMEVIEREIFNGPCEIKKIDTLRLAKHAWDLPEYKLASLRYRFSLPVLKEGVQHSAAFDAYLTLGLTLEAAHKLGIETWDELYEKAKSPIIIKKMSFGKHRGEVVADAFEQDKGYFRWLWKQDFAHVEYPDLMYTLKKLGQR